MRLHNLGHTLREAGCGVWDEPGANGRGHGDMGDVRGVLVHHTAGGGRNDWIVVRDGRRDLRGPLSALTLERDGGFRFIAAGESSHAGTGGPWRNVPHNHGSAHLVGIEIVSAGCWDCFTHEQKRELPKAIAAILRRFHLPPDAFLGHKNWTRRKIDPAFDMGYLYREVAAIMAGGHGGEDKVPGWLDLGPPDWAGNPQTLRGTLDHIDRRTTELEKRMDHLIRRLDETAAAIVQMHEELMREHGEDPTPEQQPPPL